MSRILVIRFSALGDVILLTALLEGLRIQHPGAEIWLATKTSLAPLFETDPRVDRVLALSTGRGELRRLALRLEETSFDLVIDAHGSLRSSLLCLYLSSTPQRRIRKDTLPRLFYLLGRVRSMPLSRTQIDRYLALLESEHPSFKPSLRLGEDDARAAARILSREDASAPGAGGSQGGAEGLARERRPVLAIAPGSRHATKQWPVDRFADIAHRFLEQGLGELLIVGGPGEEEVCRGIAASLPGPVTVAAGDIPLRTTAALLEQCGLLLCNDSGLLHMAEAVGTPVLSLFGPTSREWGYFPWMPQSRVIEHALPCRPCSRNGKAPCKLSEKLCLTRSTVDLVYSHLESQWRRLLYRERAASM